MPTDFFLFRLVTVLIDFEKSDAAVCQYIGHIQVVGIPAKCLCQCVSSFLSLFLKQRIGFEL